ncbi:MAG: hypothetical protein H6502_02180 [Candidatus Woesearchaeota archaeon]|nr:MAG: hypothetical protein H6502_02180 [Candidatus Woesearchaeota archaeon]
MVSLSRRAQVALFFIVALVLIIVFAFMFSLQADLAKQRARETLMQTVGDKIVAAQLDEYVASCIGNIYEDAILKLSRQGGIIYDYQGGFDPLPPDYLALQYEGDDVNVTPIISTSSSCSLVQPDPPNYPVANLPLAAFVTYYATTGCYFSDKSSGFLGDNTLAKLCDPNGPNSPRLQGADFRQLCDPDDYALLSNQSVQKQLAQYIETHLLSCVDTSVFTRLGYNITAGEPAARLLWSPQGAQINVTLPLTILVSDLGNVAVLQDFYYTSKVPFRSLYSLVNEFAAREQQDPLFFAEDNFTTLRSYESNYRLTRFGNHYIITDIAHTLLGKNFSFIVASPPRRPVLDYLHETPGELYDVVIQEGEEIVLDPLGVDPSEQNVYYQYSGWRQDYFTSFDETCCLDGLAANSSFNCALHCTLEVAGDAPYNWTNSDPWHQTFRKASFMTSPADRGLHLTTIRVTDPDGLYDEQEVRILVFDLPQAVPRVYAYSPLFSPSFEDPLFFDSSLSSTSLIYPGILTSFIWQQEGDEELSLITTQDLHYWFGQDVVPTSPGSAYFLPEDVTTGLLAANPNDRTYNLVVVQDDTVYSEPAAQTLPITACTPLVIAGSVTPFPYTRNTNPSSPLLSALETTHRCCAPANTLRGVAEVCYSFLEGAVVLGMESRLFEPYLAELANRGTATPYSVQLTNSLGIPLGDVLIASAAQEDALQTISDDPLLRTFRNDIFTLSFARNCDGIRGNACYGAIDATLEQSEDCFYDPALSEQCTGPNDEGLLCVAYTDETFEERFGWPEATGECKPTPYCDGSLLVTSSACDAGLCTPETYDDCALGTTLLDNDLNNAINVFGTCTATPRTCILSAGAPLCAIDPAGPVNYPDYCPAPVDCQSEVGVNNCVAQASRNFGTHTCEYTYTACPGPCNAGVC